MKPIYIFGEVMIEISAVSGDTSRIGVGGDTFNTAVYLSRSGMNVCYVTALGDDSFSKRILSAFRAENIDTSGCVIIPGMAPGLYAIDLDEQGERSFTYWRANSAARRFFEQPDSIAIIDNIKRAEILFLSGISLSILNAVDREKVIDIARIVKAAGGQVVFDTNYRPREWDNQDAAQMAVNEIMPYVSTALLTWEDEEALFADNNPETCAARWYAAGANEVVIKGGAHGVYAQGLGWTPPPRKLKPVDTTGAGDSFNGAYLAARLSGKSIESAIHSGHKLAAQVIMATGAIL